MSQELIDRLLDDDSSLTYEELVELDERYPYFTLPAMLLLFDPVIGKTTLGFRPKKKISE